MTNPFIKVKGGFFLILEGIDGVGKTTQAALVSALLRNTGYDVLSTREPGFAGFGEKVAELFLHNEMSEEARLLLIMAARAEHCKKVINPHLAKGGVVVCDRFMMSTCVYQNSDKTSRGRVDECAGVIRHLIPKYDLLAYLTPNFERAQEKAKNGDVIEASANFKDLAHKYWAEMFRERRRNGQAAQIFPSGSLADNISQILTDKIIHRALRNEFPPDEIANQIYNAALERIEEKHNG